MTKSGSHPQLCTLEHTILELELELLFCKRLSGGGI